MVGGQPAKPANKSRNLIGPGLYHTCCSACCGDVLSPEEWGVQMEARQAEIKRNLDQDPDREGRDTAVLSTKPATELFVCLI